MCVLSMGVCVCKLKLTFTHETWCVCARLGLAPNKAGIEMEVFRDTVGFRSLFVLCSAAERSPSV